MKKLSVIEILLQGIFSLGGVQKFLETEDIAKKSYKISPNTFCWKKYSDQIDISKVRVNLNLAKNKSYVSGNEKKGWMLNHKGLDVINASKNKLNNGFKLRILKKDKIEQQKEILRISNSTAYKNFINEKIKPSYRQMEEVFNINSYVIGEQRKRRINKVVNLCKQELTIYNFLNKNKKILNKRKEK